MAGSFSFKKLWDFTLVFGRSGAVGKPHLPGRGSKTRKKRKTEWLWT